MESASIAAGTRNEEVQIPLIVPDVETVDEDAVKEIKRAEEKERARNKELGEQRYGLEDVAVDTEYENKSGISNINIESQIESSNIRSIYVTEQLSLKKPCFIVDFSDVQGLSMDSLLAIKSLTISEEEANIRAESEMSNDNQTEIKYDTEFTRYNEHERVYVYIKSSTKYTLVGVGNWNLVFGVIGDLVRNLVGEKVKVYCDTGSGIKTWKIEKCTDIRLNL